MAKYLLQVNYTDEGVKGLLKDGGSKRRDIVAKAYESLGGKLEAFYYAFGETDLYAIAEVPDHATMMALVLAVTAPGTVTCKTTVLLTPEEVDEAAKKAPKDYTPPGK